MFDHNVAYDWLRMNGGGDSMKCLITMFLMNRGDIMQCLITMLLMLIVKQSKAFCKELVLLPACLLLVEWCTTILMASKFPGAA